MLEHSCLLLPVLLCPQPGHHMAGLEMSQADGTFQFALWFCTRLSTSVAVCWACIWLWGR